NGSSATRIMPPVVSPFTGWKKNSPSGGVQPEMSLSWLQISVITDRPQLAEAVFEQCGAEAITELDAGEDLVAEETPGSLPRLTRARVIGLFNQSTRPEPIRTALAETLGADSEISAQILDNQDWASAW